MAIDSNVVIEKIKNFEQMFVLFSTFTHHPFVVCDEETFDDQVYVFDYVKEKTDLLVKEGGIACSSGKEVAEKADVIITSAFLYVGTDAYISPFINHGAM